ncbi:MAG: 23S rRNA pseudouridine(955/2504/2580) synthase RluC [Deferrisomatales bacterium]
MAKYLKVAPGWAGRTLFEAVRQAFPEIGPREVFRKARKGEIRRNGTLCHPLDHLDPGDVLAVTLFREAPPPPAAPLRRDVPVETPAGGFFLVWEDDHLLAVSKPPGCASHPALKHGGDTLIERVRAYLGTRPADPFQPALANRLDLQTSGLVLVAKTRGAQRRLGRHLQQGGVRKLYLALVAGWPEPAAGDIRAPLLRRTDSRERRRLPPGDPRLRGRVQEARTRYRTLERLAQPLETALLELDLLTGRTHQIRRHLAGVGHPVAGDDRYGDPAFNADYRHVCGVGRMFLHAHRVALAHPATGRPLELTAPLPADLLRGVRALGSGLPGLGLGEPLDPGAEPV